ncbi:response regulator [Flagellimonas allohymeniacidonis]|uniref:Response regulator n=1 Tax=Flagellimonas allohymeniacidonis TaxID=2517819 RepID=A0A4Q8QF05_9FLAO|nr:response regulator [Allomuricauda hymeniacidonis]TAI48414.1 response regulator [Allomuricauda hymeniacidonis]
MKKVLVIEDNRDVRENIVEILELAKYTVLAAENGSIGIQIAKAELPDIIVSDIMMPGVDGYSVLETLNEDENTAGIPFVFLSAKDKREDIRKGMSLGADDYLYKPFEAYELLDAIKLRLKKSDFLQRKFSKTTQGINSFFKSASEYLGMELLSKNRKLQEFSSRGEIFQEGDAAHNLYFIEEGSVKTHRVTESGKEMVTGMHGKGDFFGQLSLLNKSGTYLETAVALEKTRLLSIPKGDFTNLVYKDREVSNKFLDIISDSMAHLQEQLVDIAYSSVKQRAAKALLELHDKGFIQDSKQKGVDILREDLASMIGTAKETAIRALTEFREQGLVGVGKKRRLILLDRSKLQRIADFG